MSLEAGSKLGPYEILGLLGAGGMGEVYRARDPRLGREVAVKVLSDAFVADADRLARFQREARSLAALSDSGIASIHDVGREGDTHYLVMELAPGETLATRIGRGPLPVEEALRIAIAIAAALEAAHARGIVHRDLKPANVMVDEDGRVKVLDFGLARVVEAETGAASSPDASASPTLSHRATQAGVLLGTAAYMAPEQARGRPADQRADVWAFGVVLLEMLTGQPAFREEDLTETLASVLRSEPDLARLPASVPSPVRRVIERCLRKQPGKRLHHVADARIELEDALAGSAAGEPAGESPQPRRAGWRNAAALGLGALLGGALVWGALDSRLRSERSPIRVELQGVGFLIRSAAALSPDGRSVAYSPGDRWRETEPLHIRRFDERTGTPIPGTEGATNPFFAPDGRSIAYFRDRSLFVVDLGGGTPSRLAGVLDRFAQGTWGDDGTIVFSGGAVDGQRSRGLTAVPAAGGASRALTRPAEGEQGHDVPFVLPGAEWVLFDTWSPRPAIHAVSLTDGSRHAVMEGVSTPHFVPPGHLVVYRPDDRSLLAVPFDAGAATVTGPPVVVERRVVATVNGGGAFDVAADTLIASTSPDGSTGASGEGPFRVVWVDRRGRTSPAFERVDTWAQPRLSPDGGSFVVRQTGSPDCSIWSYDIARGILSRLPTRGDAHEPTWHPGGGSIAYSSSGDTLRVLLEQPSDGSGEPRVLLDSEADARAPSWSAGGRLLGFTRSSESSGSDLFVRDGDGRVTALLVTPYEDRGLTFSPAGELFAYVSNASGRDEVYVRNLDRQGAGIQVSTGGGQSPRWARDGRTLFYVQSDRLMEVGIEPTPELRISPPREVFRGEVVRSRTDNYDVDGGGERFLMLEDLGAGRAAAVEVTLGWRLEALAGE